MSTATLWEFLVMIPTAICAGYAIVWAIPGVIVSIIISMGSLKHIIYLDKQLAKDLGKLYDSSGQIRNPLFTTIANRYHKYCIAYPFIRHRATTDSVKFKVFMWLNTLGFWSWIGVFVFGGLAESLGIIG
jgi:hypothetical protein